MPNELDKNKLAELDDVAFIKKTAADFLNFENKRVPDEEGLLAAMSAIAERQKLTREELNRPILQNLSNSLKCAQIFFYGKEGDEKFSAEDKKFSAALYLCEEARFIDNRFLDCIIDYLDRPGKVGKPDLLQDAVTEKSVVKRIIERNKEDKTFINRILAKNEHGKYTNLLAIELNKQQNSFFGIFKKTSKSIDNLKKELALSLQKEEKHSLNGPKHR